MAFVLWHAIWFAFLCRRAFSGVAGGDWSVPPYEGDLLVRNLRLECATHTGQVAEAC